MAARKKERNREREKEREREREAARGTNLYFVLKTNQELGN